MAQPRLKHTILLLDSSPDDTERLELGVERAAIDRELRGSDQRDAFELRVAEQVEAAMLPGLIMRHEPRILHFSGHGNEQGELLFRRANGSRQAADTTVIADVFGLSSKSIRCVVLNACYSEIQAKLIAQHVDIVVGIRRTLDDRSAIAFSAGFYEALGYNQSFAVAFELGKARMRLTEMFDEDQLVLHCRDGVDPATATLAPPQPRPTVDVPGPEKERPASELLRRFTEGEAGRRRVAEQLQRQPAVDSNAELAATLAEVVQVERFLPGELLIQQGSDDCDIYFVIAGEVAVEIRGREVARRSQAQHVGEMALIDPSQLRSASIRALTETIAAKVSEETFSRIAERHPRMWRRLALDLSGRLRERGLLVRRRNEKPVMFVGSSSTPDGLALARGLQTALSHDPCVVRLWTDGVFEAGKTNIESLAAQLSTVDFAVLVVTPDDLVTTSKASTPSPRDNVIFELGLMMGALGRERTFMVKIRSRPEDLKVPTDLLGVQPLEVAIGTESDLLARMGPVANELRNILQRLGSR